MATTTAKRKAPAQEEESHWDENYARIPLWLARGTGKLTHAQFHVLVALIALLGGRKSGHHVSYRQLAACACTDKQTVTTAIHMFVKAEWLTVTGGTNWRRYKIDLDRIQADVYQEYTDEEDD
jgi:DNA-binding MarR family transcriptional regulator